MSELFNTHLTEKPLFLCDVASTYDLLDIWIELAAGNGNRECETIEMPTCAVATGLGDTNLAPVISPDLSKKVVGVHVAGKTSTTSQAVSTLSSWWCKIAPPLEPRSSALMHSLWPATVTLWLEVQQQQNHLMFVV